MIRDLTITAALLIAGLAGDGSAQESPYLVVLGIGQDGGVPQAGNKNDLRWEDRGARRLVVSLGVVDPATSHRWLFEATPDFREQLHRLDMIAPVPDTPGLSGIFLTHAHMGHYTGLMFLGHESMGASGTPVYAVPRMAEFLENNGPWSQLVEYHNIDLRRLRPGEPVAVAPSISVTAFDVPHRQEYSEVVGFRIDGPNRSVLFIPDIDSWEEMDDTTPIEELLAGVDVAYLDGSFFANGEIPGRDMSGFPHPFISHSMQRFASLPAGERAKIRFIHLNHTNPALDPEGEAARQVREAGFGLAVEGDRIGL